VRCLQVQDAHQLARRRSHVRSKLPKKLKLKSSHSVAVARCDHHTKHHTKRTPGTATSTSTPPAKSLRIAVAYTTTTHRTKISTTMLGRQVTAALGRPLQARLRTTADPQTHYNLAIRTFSHAPRLLDPAGRPRKAVGEPSRPVKRAVKKAAKKPATPMDDAAVAAVAEKKRLAKEKLAAAKLKQKKKDAAAVQKAKEAAMTPEELAKKKAALQPPFPSRANGAWNFFVREKGKDLKGSVDAPVGERRAIIRSNLAEHIKKLGAAWHELPASDIEVGFTDLRT
jgi:hypothetical protein